MKCNSRQLNHEITWLREQMATKKLTQKQRREYERQIKHKELTISLAEDARDLAEEVQREEFEERE